MNRATVLRRAARLVENGEVMYGCHAINDAEGVGHYTDSPAIRLYELLFKGGDDGSGEWHGCWFGWAAESYEYGPRIVALCLAAAVADDASGVLTQGEKP